MSTSRSLGFAGPAVQRADNAKGNDPNPFSGTMGHKAKQKMADRVCTYPFDGVLVSKKELLWQRC